MFLGDVGDTDIHKYNTTMIEMRACSFITSRDRVTMHKSEQFQQELEHRTRD